MKNTMLSIVEAIYLLAPLAVLGLGIYLVFFTAITGGGWLMFLALMMYPSIRNKVTEKLEDGSTKEKSIDSN